MYFNSVVSLFLLAIVLVPFLGLVYSVFSAWFQAGPAPEITEQEAPKV